MPDPELHAPAGFYFALPRLVMKLRGGNARRSERSWLEANLVGFAVFGISYLILARLLPSSFRLVDAPDPHPAARIRDLPVLVARVYT